MLFVLHQLLHASRKVAFDQFYKSRPVALVQFANDGNVLDLFFGKFAVGTVDLGEDVAGVDKQDLVVSFGLVEKPQGGRQRDRVEHVGRQGEHAVNQIVVDQVFADVGFGMTGIGGRVGHDQPGAAFGFERGGEQVYPQIVAVGHGFLAVVLFAPSLKPKG